MFNPVIKTFEFGGTTVTLETGKVARQATDLGMLRIMGSQLSPMPSHSLAILPGANTV